MNSGRFRSKLKAFFLSLYFVIILLIKLKTLPPESSLIWINYKAEERQRGQVTRTKVILAAIFLGFDMG